MFGNLIKQVTKVAADISSGVINGTTDVTEAFTGKNAVTRTMRRAGNGVIGETKDFIDGIVDLGESALTGGLAGDDAPERSDRAQTEEKTNPEDQR